MGPTPTLARGRAVPPRAVAGPTSLNRLAPPMAPVVLDRLAAFALSAALAPLAGAYAQVALDSALAEPYATALAEGAVYKLAVDETGVYRVDAALLRELGVDPAAAPPRSLRLYSKGGAMLPEVVGAPYPTGLPEVALLEVGDGDDAWDEGERLVFYGEGEDVWSWVDDAAGGGFVRTEHLYDERTYYYLEVGGDGRRVAEAPPVEGVSAYDDVYTARARHEVDEHNIMRRRRQLGGPGQGSGQEWFGFEFGNARQTTVALDLGEVVGEAGPGRLRARFVASAVVAGTRFRVDAAGASFETGALAPASRTKPEAAYAHFASVDEPLTLAAGRLEATVAYPGNPEDNLGWLDYLQVTHPARLRYDGAALTFRSARHAPAGAYGFAVRGGGGAEVLDVSDPLAPVRVATETSGPDLRFGYRQNADGAPREFVAFDPRRDARPPTVVGSVAPSNLHGLEGAEMLIVYADTLRAAAEALAAHRRAHDGYRVALASTSQVADEFGGGRHDPSATRALARMLWSRDGALRFVLLLGDGTYDPRGLDEATREALAPTYQTANVNLEVAAFPTDDYFALLELGEGRRPGRSFPEGDLDVGVGRIPAGTPEEAEALVAKIIRYDTDPAMLGEWRLRNVFVADDQDRNLHVDDMDEIAERDLARAPEFNQVKIYVDAYDQVATAGEQRYPDAAEAITQNMLRGNLVTTYLGHGGPNGWGQERFLNDPDIANWDNGDALPVLVTATCTFTGFDDPFRAVAGEKVLFKPRGGAVATMSTTRPVFTTANKVLTRNTHDLLLDDSLALAFGIGELMARAKNASNNTQNDRKYSLFGDPALRLAIPELRVAVTSFDSVDLATSGDTVAVASLREVTLAGEVLRRDGALATGFDGVLTLTIFDQERTGRTLGQDGDSFAREFRRGGATLFNGRASVIGGLWQARFMLPRDVSLARGLGRVSLYAAGDDGRDGAGLFERFLVDGLAPPAVDDDAPPTVTVGMDDLDFRPGGVTTEDPVIVAALADDTGINVSGTSIGHDLTATLRGPDDAVYVLNDFYEADVDDYARGTVAFPLFDLPPGEYALELRAWDLANNTATDTTRFLVLGPDEGPGLRRVLAFPNPLTETTCFGFEHAVAGETVEVAVDIYTASGRHVRTLRYAGTATGTRFGADDCVRWDGTDAGGGPLAKGVYLYRVSLATADGASREASSFERIVVAK